MSEETLTTSQLSGAEITMEVTQITSEYSEYMTGPALSPRSVYFEIVVVVIGLVGTTANALILYALVASKQHKKHMLIFNQNALDLFSSIFLIISNAMKLCNVRFTGLLGHWLCTILLNDVVVTLGIIGSTINLASITVERYLKVVHPGWSKKKLRSWMIYSAAAFAWLFSALYKFALVSMTAMVVDGSCYASFIWQSETARLIHAIWYLMSFYVIILLIVILGYWRILVFIRRQARVMAGHSAPGSSTGQTQSTHIQTNVIKTMILVSAFFAISQLPYHLLYLTVSLNPKLVIAVFDIVYYTSMFAAFLYICTNPFIYAIKFDPVKQVLLRLIPCKKNSDQTIELN